MKAKTGDQDSGRARSDRELKHKHMEHENTLQVWDFKQTVCGRTKAKKQDKVR